MDQGPSTDGRQIVVEKGVGNLLSASSTALPCTYRAALGRDHVVGTVVGPGGEGAPAAVLLPSGQRRAISIVICRREMLKFQEESTHNRRMEKLRAGRSFDGRRAPTRHARPVSATRPASRAKMMAWARSSTPSLRKMAERWLATVFWLIPSRCATARLRKPVARSGGPGVPGG